jgi:multiple sugar transport system substrate-binding protein
LGRLIQV